ncbi:MAG: hypothetical protein GYA87_06625, partial [Christensenellaceae bacterium]|nr:hypothetical protein [Christensenellaceae bacterium]
DYDIGNFNSKFNQELNKNNVTLQYGLDWFNLDKKHYAMTNNSSQVIVPDTTQKGAAIAYFEIYTIDNTINIPDDNFNLDIPVAIDGKGKAKQMTIPIKLINNGQIKKYHGEDKYLDYGKIYNIDAKISPLKIYLSLKMDFYECADNDDCQNIINYWREFALVDKYGNIYGYSGNVVSSGYFVDDNGTTHITKEIQYYPAENYPNELYIAPVGYFGNENELTSNIDMAIKLIGG